MSGSWQRALSFSAFIIAAAMLTGGAVRAQMVAPQVLDNPQPEPPTGRFGMPRQGWVVLRYSVLANGSTDNVRAVDRMPPLLPDREAVRAVEEWRFEPAMADGEPVDWHNNETVIVYRSEEAPSGPTPIFLRGYQEAQELLAEEDPDKALNRNERLIGSEATRLNEMGLAQMQNALINMRLNDLHAAYEAIRRATDPRVPALDGADLTVALQYRNVLELQVGDVMAALATWDRRNAVEPVPADDPAAAGVAAVREALAGDAAIAVRGRIGDDFWKHPLSRRTFAFGEVDGSLDTVQFECDRRRAELEFSADSEWTLPESWGACTVIVEGRRRSEFVLYEFR